MTNYTVSPEIKQEIASLYKAGLSSQEIKEKLALPQTPRTIQRIVKAFGLSRTVGESFRLAIVKGRVKWRKRPTGPKRKRLSTKLRFQVLALGNFRCRLCGATASDDSPLEVDHIDENRNNNDVTNLQVLCEDCNKGKYWSSKL